MKHIYFLGIGGAGIGPLALLAHKTGYLVSGSDKQNSKNIASLIKDGIENIAIQNCYDHLVKTNQKRPIDWIVFSSALILENPDSKELKYAQENNIKFTKRDQFVDSFIKEHRLKLIAIAGTHGKTTTTAMLVWLFKALSYPVSFLLAAGVNYASQAEFNPKSEYFIYEADEFDRNFLSFNPEISLISGLGWDHQEIYPTKELYKQAFRDFLNQSRQGYIWEKDLDYLNFDNQNKLVILNEQEKFIEEIKLKGLYNRRDAFLVLKAFADLAKIDFIKLIPLMSAFPGLQRRMEEIAPNLYSDYAHTPEKIRAAINVAIETAKDNQKIVIIYEPLTNRRQHYIKKDYANLFEGVSKIYWVNSYLAREDPNQVILSPEDLIKYLNNPEIAIPSKLGPDLKKEINRELKNNNLVVAISGGGGNSLDEWIRNEFRV